MWVFSIARVRRIDRLRAVNRQPPPVNIHGDRFGCWSTRDAAGLQPIAALIYPIITGMLSGVATG